VGLFKRMLHPVRRAARRFALLPLPEDGDFIGAHGCIRAAASFMTWNQIPGDYFEFGVYRGESFAVAYRTIEHLRAKHIARGHTSPEYEEWKNRPPRYVAFDGFGGLPPGQVKRHVDYHEGSYSCSEAEFRANVAAAGVDLSRVVVVPGFYDESLNAGSREQHKLDKVAVAMIDCDLYESTVPVLDFLTDMVQQGTILIFHDWFRFKGDPNEGEQRACNEWLAKNPQLELIEYWREAPQAVSFLVNFK